MAHVSPGEDRPGLYGTVEFPELKPSDQEIEAQLRELREKLFRARDTIEGRTSDEGVADPVDPATPPMEKEPHRWEEPVNEQERQPIPMVEFCALEAPIEAGVLGLAGGKLTAAGWSPVGGVSVSGPEGARVLRRLYWRPVPAE